MPKPQWRNNDDIPARGDDITIKALGVEITASGKTVTGMLGTATVLGALLFLYWNISALNDTVGVMTCVLTLTEEQRRDFRTQGSYCGSYEVNKDIRKFVKEEAKK